MNQTGEQQKTCISSAVVLVGGDWAAEKKTACKVCALDQVKLMVTKANCALTESNRTCSVWRTSWGVDWVGRAAD